MTTKTREQVERAYRVLDHIERNPEKHSQGFWVDSDRRETAATVMAGCGTTACFAGWTALLAGAVYTGHGSWMELGGSAGRTSTLAAELLGLTGDEVDALFFDAADLAAVRKAVFEIFGPRPDGAV